MQPQQTPGQTPIPQWFITEQPVTTQKPRKKWRLVAMFAATIVVLTVTVVVLTFSFSAPACLTAQDYEDLTGVSYDGKMAAANSFYTGIIDFKDTSNSYSKPTQITQLVNFYKEHATISIRFTVTGTYLREDQSDIAYLRTATIQKSLISAGVPAELITIEPPVPLQSLEAVEAADSEATTISITSAAECRQG